MEPSGPFVEIQVIRTVELVESVKDVFTSMGMHDIKEDCQTHPVGGVNEFLQIFWGSIARACCKEAGDLIPKC